MKSPWANRFCGVAIALVLSLFFVACGVGSSSPGGAGGGGGNPLPTAVSVTVDVLTDRHVISPYVYGGAYPKDAAHITDSGTSVVRWGGNGAFTYNWQLFTYNADNDYFFEDFASSEIGDPDSVPFIKDVKTAGSNPLMTMVMLPWVAKGAETSLQQGGASNHCHWSFSVTKYGSQCAMDQFNTDAGNGVGADCSTPITADPNDGYFALLDDHSSVCPTGATCLYRSDWAAALGTAFGGARTSMPSLMAPAWPR
jgi:Glycoside hydrolase family 44